MAYASVYILFGWLLVEFCVWNSLRGGQRLTFEAAMAIVTLWPLMLLTILYQLLRKI